MENKMKTENKEDKQNKYSANKNADNKGSSGDKGNQDNKGNTVKLERKTDIQIGKRDRIDDTFMDSEIVRSDSE